MKNNTTCKFCGQEKKLIKAHIIPRKFYLDYKSEKYVGVNSQTGEFVLQQCGSYDKNILCEDCDSKILRICCITFPFTNYGSFINDF